MQDLLQVAKEKAFHSRAYLPHLELEPAIDLLFSGVYHDAVLFGESNEKGLEIHWAADSIEDLLAGVQQVMAEQSRPLQRVYLEFIPPAWEPAMLAAGFSVVSEWVDAFLTGLDQMSLRPSGRVPITELSKSDIQLVAQITQSCTGYSREFRGETAQQVRDWLQDEPVSSGFIAWLGERAIGAVLTSMYGFDSPKGSVCFLRELAVSPLFQRRGVGKELCLAAFAWGKQQGATRSFLHVDICNEPAISLYEKLGFELVPGRGQINMARMLPS